VKADPLSAQVEIETCAWDVLPQHLRAAGIVDVDELERLRAPPHYAEAPEWT
jgi:hypothetical protein